MRKNEIYELEITATGTDGSGIGRVENMVVFVPGAAEGDTLRVRILKVLKNRAYGKIEQMLTASPWRQVPDCPVSDKCGGCVFRHISYEAEKQIKTRRVADAIHRIGKIDLEPQSILAQAQRTRYRNKAQYPVGAGGIGFYALHSHRIVDCNDCALQPHEFTQIVDVFRRWMAQYGVPAYDETESRGVLRHIYIRKAFATGQIMVVAVIHAHKLPFSNELVQMLTICLGEKLKSLQYNINTADTNVVLGEKCVTIYGEPTIEDILCGVRVRISPHSFYQVNREMAQRLYEKAAEYADPAGKIILDLYCGAGTIGLSMAKSAARIIGVEITPQAVADAQHNAKCGGFENAEFICGDAAAAAQKLAQRGIHPDVVILDPPRKGCTPKLLQTVAQNFAPERIVYVSCDPATLARDLHLLQTLGYTLREYTPADLFPGTAHVETVCLLSRSESDE